MSSTSFSKLDNTIFPHRCGCMACQSVAKGDTSSSNNKQTTVITDIVGGGDESLSYAPTITATPTQFANYLTDGFWADVNADSFQWEAGQTITYSISNSYSASQKAGIGMAFDQWSDVANVTFSAVTSGGAINIITNTQGRAFSQNTGGYYQGDDVIVTGNTISMDTSKWFWQNFNELGDYALLTAIHEIGHSLGLGHTGNYNGSATYEANAQFINDSRQYSVMSYFDADKTGSNHLGEYGSTPMIYDILAIQNIYGANNLIRSGDTVYGFNSNAGRDQFDFTVNTVPVVAIWDGAGTDTIDLSGWSMTQMINLNDGEFSNVGGGTGNLAVAINARIENAIGGSGVDTIYGNEWDNVISGNAGADVIYGSTGNDTINGGNDSDRVIYSYDLTDFTATIVNASTIRLAHNSLGFTDTISNVENFSFNGTDYSFAQLENATQLDVVAISVFGDGWSIKEFNERSGENTLTSANAGLGGSTEYVNIIRTDNTTLSVSNVSDATNTYVASTVLDNLTISDFITSDVYMLNNSGVTLRVENVQNGKLTTGDGNDQVTFVAGLHDYSGRTVYNITTGGGSDVINLAAANSSLYAYVSAGAGNDIITFTTDMRSKVFGGDGDDNIRGHNGDDVFLGENGIDTIRGGDGNDYINGGDGNDILDGQRHNDQLYGGNGDDELIGGDGDDRLYGQNDNDDLDGGDGADYLDGGNGDDTINGGNGNDVLAGRDGIDILNGGAGNDRFVAGNGDDTLNGDAGNDVMYGNDGDDLINGGADNDFMDGGNDNDTLDGGDGSDRVYGGNGNDELTGGLGLDALYGGAGDDILIGIGDGDSIYGQGGADIFALTDYNAGRDRWFDFNLAEGDAINITDVLIGYTNGVDDINDYVSFLDRGGFTDMLISRDGTQPSYQAVSIWDNNSLDGLSVNDLVASGDLIFDQTVL